MKKITQKQQSWLDKFDKAEGYNNIGHSKAWMVIFDLCLERGIISTSGELPAIVEICEFIDSKTKKPKIR